MNGIIAINKEKGMTSRDVVNKICKMLHTKAVGHTGTLDPMATGVLLVCVGKSTKLVELLTSTYKEYIAEIKLGILTDTLDIEGEVLEEKNYDVSYQQALEVLNSFLGVSQQVVPKYSAISVNGKRLYEYAREGIFVELPVREIEVKNIELLNYNDGIIKFKVMVSKGTYIRSLVRDISEKLGTVGTMISLERTKQGFINISETYKLSEIESGNYIMLKPIDVLKDIVKIEIDDELYNKVKNGAIIDKLSDDKLVGLLYNSELVAIYKTYEKNNELMKPYKMMIGE